MKSFTLHLLFLLLILASAPALAQILPPSFVPSELERLGAEAEKVGEPYPGVLLTPKSVRNDTEEKYRQSYKALCGVYAGERGTNGIVRYALRFLVHIPDTDMLPFGKRVARLYLLLHGANRERTGRDHPRSEPEVEVWLTRQSGAGLATDVGGEQFKNQIYLYNIYKERPPVEWAREIAHEYGHYALPGISGFTAPEEWGNGVLGERLFLKWLRDDVREGKLNRESNLPFVTPELLEEVHQRQIAPLMRRLLRDGADERAIRKKDADGMDYFTGLVLYMDTVYGSRQTMDAFACTESAKGNIFVQAPDFLRGIRKSLADSTEFRLTAPLLTTGGKTDGFFVYFPRGEFTITASAPLRSWSLPENVKGISRPTGSKDLLHVGIAGWHKLSLSLEKPAEGKVTLTFHRRGTELD